MTLLLRIHQLQGLARVHIVETFYGANATHRAFPPVYTLRELLTGSNQQLFRWNDQIQNTTLPAKADKKYILVNQLYSKWNAKKCGLPQW